MALPMAWAYSQMNIGLSRSLVFWLIQAIPGYIFE